MDFNENYNKDVSSKLKMTGLYIESASFERKEQCDKNININVSHNIESNENEYIIKLIINIENNDSSLKVSVSMIGKFQCEEERLIEKNAIAIMFPYIRSYVSTLTTQPGLNPIVLQPVNVLSLLGKD